MSLISTRMSSIKPSPTLQVNARAKELISKGIQVISLAVGEPDFDTPDNIKEAAIRAIEQGFTKYTETDGIKELKNAIINKFSRENNLEYSLSEVMVSSGGKQVIYNAFMASINEGDEVIIPAPYWVSYPDMALLAGGKPVFVECGKEDNFKLTPQKLEKAISPKTKWLIINSPSNPTGETYTRAELEGLANILVRHPNVYIMSDDIYEHIIFDGQKFYNILEIEPSLKDRVLIVNGVSKSYSMTGWRIGYGAGPAALIKQMSVIQSQSTSNPCSISQKAAVEALTGTQDFISTNREGFERKRDLVISILEQLKELDCNKPTGAFYVFPACKAFYGLKTGAGLEIKNDIDFCNYLLEEANIAVVPGSAFGLEGYFRISYATSEEVLADACMHLIKACKALMK